MKQEAVAAPVHIRWRAILAVVGLVVLIGIANRPSSPVRPNLSDAAMTAAMVSNMELLPDSTASIRRNADGSPDIAVSGGVLIVVTLNPATAPSLCRSVAAITNDSATGKPLGISLVAIISGGHKITDCRP